MRPGNGFNVLTIYEILTDLIPGTIVLISFLTLFRVSPPSSSVSGLAVIQLLFGGFVIGHVLRYLRQRTSSYDLFFEKLYNPETDIERYVHERLPRHFRITRREHQNNENDKSDPYSGMDGIEALFLMLHSLETPPLRRGLRIEATFSFYRNMLVGSLVVCLLSITGLVVKWIAPSHVSSIYTLWGFLAGSVLAFIIFKNRKDTYESFFVKYIFIDFYLSLVDYYKDNDQKNKQS